MQFPAEIVKKLLLDPVMAAKVLMGYDLDHFQAAALRIDWWFPETIDSSGVSTGKTLRIFILVNLRCLLMPDHVAGVYFPNFQTAKDEFWPYYKKTREQSPIFRQQCEMFGNKVGEQKQPGAWIFNYKNGSRVIMPAPSFLNDSKTQAGRRFNTLVVDDWLKAEEMGDGIAKQLVDRVTRPNWNQNHPIWANHTHFKGHADKPSHSGYPRYRAYRKLIRKGSVRHAVYSFCFRDFSPARARALRPDATIKTQRGTLSKDQFRRQWLGLWSRDGSTFYPEAVLARAWRAYIRPVFRRQNDEEINCLGTDVAPGQSIKADSSAFVNCRIIELGRHSSYPVTYETEGRAFNVAFTFASFQRNQSAPECAAFMHMLHRLFHFARIVLDPGGGGLWVYKELKKTEQLINGRLLSVTPLCTPTELITVDKQPIVHFFKRGGELDRLSFIEPQNRVSDDGFIDAMHTRFREAWEVPQLHWPTRIEERDEREVAAFSPDELNAQRFLDTCFHQLTTVNQITKDDGTPLVSKRGFKMFEAPGKKDGAYAAMYAFAGAMHALETGYDARREEEEVGFYVD